MPVSVLFLVFLLSAAAGQTWIPMSIQKSLASFWVDMNDASFNPSYYCRKITTVMQDDVHVFWPDKITNGIPAFEAKCRLSFTPEMLRFMSHGPPSYNTINNATNVNTRHNILLPDGTMQETTSSSLTFWNVSTTPAKAYYVIWWFKDVVPLPQQAVKVANELVMAWSHHNCSGVANLLTDDYVGLFPGIIYNKTGLVDLCNSQNDIVWSATMDPDFTHWNNVLAPHGTPINGGLKGRLVINVANQQNFVVDADFYFNADVGKGITKVRGMGEYWRNRQDALSQLHTMP
eukprot:TRINITY_DN116562_c0_g1_i1.p1 TRINITY_DN116562_c0_g1~~TRINITY_DN116562_c0_g1_i1.p1  ORF type:complete len:289 (+),score=44.97 TRINITY_DN116562_c0_g1_i1:20-886(+)